MSLFARLHAFRHSLFRPSELALVEEAYERLIQCARDRGAEGVDRDALIARVASAVIERLGETERRLPEVLKLIRYLIDYEDMLILPTVDWRERHTIAELWTIRDAIVEQRRLFDNFDLVTDIVAATTARVLGYIDGLLPSCSTDDGITVPTSKLDLFPELGRVVEAVEGAWFSDEIERHELFPRLRARLQVNLVSASGGNPEDARSHRAPRMPSKAQIPDRNELVDAYLGNTPLTSLFEGTLPFTIPTSTRFEHHHIVAGSGHGKTQTLQYLIANDLEQVAQGGASVVVLDSQGDLIETISQLKLFAPGEPLHDRLCLIDPTDVEYPVSLNLFDVGMERLQTYPMLERERLTNSILELYDFVLGSLLSAEMTQKQSVIFRYVTRLMLHIPDSTIHTLRELMEPGSEAKFAQHIRKLGGTAHQFFDTEFASREFTETKRQVLRRLWGILENQTFERMFSHPRSKLDLFSEMNSGKVILINTAKDLLKETGTEIFGRFFIALIAQAAQERAVLKEGKRMPTFVYIDEAADYFDRNVGIILSQARKFKVGMVLAHQYLGQLDPKLQDAFAANTAIKFAGGVSNKDARALAPMLGCEPEFIERQRKGSFAASVRGQTRTALPLRFPLGHMERMPRMNNAQRVALRTAMRDRYAVHYSELASKVSVPNPPPAEEPAPPREVQASSDDPNNADVRPSAEL